MASLARCRLRHCEPPAAATTSYTSHGHTYKIAISYNAVPSQDSLLRGRVQLDFPSQRLDYRWQTSMRHGTSHAVCHVACTHGNRAPHLCSAAVELLCACRKGLSLGNGSALALSASCSYAGVRIYFIRQSSRHASASVPFARDQFYCPRLHCKPVSSCEPTHAAQVCTLSTLACEVVTGHGWNGRNIMMFRCQRLHSADECSQGEASMFGCRTDRRRARAAPDRRHADGVWQWRRPPSQGPDRPPPEAAHLKGAQRRGAD